MNITILKTKNTNFYINRNKVSGVARKTGSGRKGPSSGSAGGVFLAVLGWFLARGAAAGLGGQQLALKLQGDESEETRALETGWGG